MGYRGGREDANEGDLKKKRRGRRWSHVNLWDYSSPSNLCCIFVSIQITSEAEAAGAQADDLQAKIDAMKRQLQDVQGRFIDNEAKIDEATLAAQDASDTADLVQQVTARRNWK